MHLRWFGLLCDITLVLVITVLAVPYNMKVKEMVDFNQAAFSVGLCNSRGVWNASQHYKLGDCVLFVEDNCIYMRHDDSTESRHSAASEVHRWIAGGPSLKHFAPVVCVPRDLPPVQPHEIPLYMHLMPLYDSIVNYCNAPDRHYELQDWLARFFYEWQDPNHMCIVELLGTLALPKNTEMPYLSYNDSGTNPPYNDLDRFIVRFMMRSNQCTAVSSEFLSSVRVLTRTVLIRYILIGGFRLIYILIWTVFDSHSDSLVNGGIGIARLILLTIPLNLFDSYLVGYPQVKIPNVYYAMCLTKDLSAGPAMVFYNLLFIATMIVALYSPSLLLFRKTFGTTTTAVEAPVVSAAKTSAAQKPNVNVKNKKGNEDKKKTK